MVVVILNTIQFEAERFETRTMPTPNMKGKEVIYWIKVATEDKRLATDLQRFLEGAAQYIDLRVPSAFISAKTELESFTIVPSRKLTTSKSTEQEKKSRGNSLVEEGNNAEIHPEMIRLEIVLRRTLPETSTKLTQSPYG